jgi:cellulose synthase/poly-beta-1,6-N-acetylglucosamine synthase-like glycosyltransferase
MTLALATIFWCCTLLLVYVYLGYPATLFVWSLAVKLVVKKVSTNDPIDSVHGPVSVVVLACDEEPVIRHRIADILSQDAPIGEVIIGSDGSTDGMAAAARGYADDRVRVLEFPNRRGRALVSNDCVRAARFDVVVFTDADTEFKHGFVKAIVRPFADPVVGVTVGKQLWRTAGSERVGVYWAFELGLRSLESSLGLLATASGPCMAVRKACFEELLPDEDVDFSTPIQAVRNGFKVVYAAEAVATDEGAPSAGAEFRARARMVTKNVAGTLRELRRTSFLAHPGLWWSIVSHKLLRWMTPVFVITIPLAVLGPDTARIRALVFALYAGAAAAVCVGGASTRRNLRVPVATHAWSLAVVNAGMLAGLLQAGLGRRISTWDGGKRRPAG